MLSWGTSLKDTSIGFGGSSSSTSQPSAIPATLEFSRRDLGGGLAPSTSSANEKAELEASAWQASVQSRVQPGREARLSLSATPAGARLSLSATPAGGGSSAASAGTERPADLQTAEETLQNFASLEGALQELKKNVRMEGFDENTAANRDELRRAEERRKREEKERKAREKTRELKDPHRRVNAMLEQGREFGQSRPDQVRDAKKLRVPVQNYHSLHNNGAERIEMVNVQALQGQCVGLQNGCTNFTAIMQMADEHEKQKKWYESTLPPPELRKDFVKENMVPTSNFSSKKSAKQTALKQMQALKRRKHAGEVNALTTLEQVRNTWRMEADPSGRLCCSREVAQALQEVSAAAQHAGVEIPDYLKHQGKLREEKEREKLRRSGNLSSLEISDAGEACEKEVSHQVTLSTPQRNSFSSSPTGAAPAQLTTHSPQSQRTSSGDLFGSRSASPKGPKSPAGRGSTSFSETFRRKVEAKRHQVDLRSRVRRLWVVVKAVRRILFLRVLFRRREQAQPVLTNFLACVREHSLLKRAVHSFLCKIVIVQRKVRSFQAKKKVWCEAADAQWRQVENRHLEAYAKAKEKELRMDEMDRPRPVGRQSVVEQQSLRRSISTGRASVIDNLNIAPWSHWRIQKKHRMFTLARYYNFLCKHSAQQFETLCDVIRIRNGEHRDLQEFFKGYDFEVDLKESPPTEQGADSRAGKKKQGQKQGPAIDAQEKALLSEGEVLGLISIAAFELRNDTRFQDHPANAGLDEEDFKAAGQISGRFRRVIQQRDIEAASADTAASSTARRGSVWSSSSSMRKSQAALQDEVSDQPLDVEALMERFSPRFLQEVASAQAAAKEGAEDAEDMHQVSVNGG